MKKVYILALLLVGMIALTACGGNSTTIEEQTISNPDITTPDQPDIVEPDIVEPDITVPSHKTQLSVLYNSDSNIAVISWDESKYKDSVGYRLEKSEINAIRALREWSEVITLSAGSGNYSAQDYTLVAVNYRIVALSDEVLLSGDNSATELVVNPIQTSAIYFSNGDANVTMPLNRSVTVNTLVESATNIQKVIYYIDTKRIGESSVKPNFPLSINTATYTNGNHRLDNELKIDDSSYITFYTPISTYNTNLNLSLRLGATTGIIPIIATASSKESLNGVRLYLDNQLVADIKEKNYCSSLRYGCGDTNDSYKWDWNSTNYSPATYAIRAEVSDSGGESLTKEITHLLNNPPVITVTSPLNESVVGNTLLINGSVSDDQNDTTVTIKVGSQTIYSSKTNNFSTSYVMSGLAEKIYTVEIKATDSSNKSTIVKRNVLYKADSDLQVWKTLGVNSAVLQINNDYLLYKDANALVRLNLSTQDLKSYDLGTTHYDRYYDISSSGKIAFYGTKLTFDSSIFLADNTLSIIGVGQHPILNNDYALWINSYYSKMHLYSFATGATLDIEKPSDSKYWLNWSYYLNTQNFCASANISSSPSNYDVYVYNLTTKQNTRLTNTLDTVEMCQGIDETRVLFAEYNSAPNKLYYASLSNLSSHVKLSENFSGTPKLVDGVMAWVDGDDKFLYSLGKNETTPLQVANNAQLREVKNGVLTYTKDSKLYLYKDGVSSEIWPYSDSHYIDGGFVYIIRGSDKLVYRVEIK